MVDETYRPLVHEIFAKINNAKVKAKKIAILKQYDTKGLRRLLKAAFDPSISFMMPDGDVPFITNEAPEGTEHSRLEIEARALQNYVQKTINDRVIPGNKNINSMKREMMFIQLLEGLCEGEAKALLHIKNKTLNKEYQGLNSANVRAAFNWNEKFMQDGQT
jgi:hypothetical protein